MNFCLWITGLPGSGKSTITKELEGLLSAAEVERMVLRLDEIRKVLTPEPTYTDDEREIVYRALAMMAQLLTEHSGKSVIIDATGNRRHYRRVARGLIAEFAEIYVSCPLKICRERESLRHGKLVERDLYEKAARGELEGQLPGVTTPYEAPEKPEVTVASDMLSPSESAERIMSYIQTRWLC